MKALTGFKDTWSYLKKPTNPFVLFIVPLSFALLSITLGYQVRSGITISMEPTNAGFLRGFYEPERSGDREFRWTRQRASIDIPGLGAANWLLRLELAAGPRNGNPPPTVIFAVGGEPIGKALVAAGPAWYDLYIPRRLVTSGNVNIGISTPTFRPRSDPRDLGVAVFGVYLQPTGAILTQTGFVVPSLGTTLSLAGAIGLLGVLVAVLGGSARSAMAVSAVLSLATGFALAFHRIALTPYASQVFWVALGLLAAATVPWRLLRYRRLLAQIGYLSGGVSLVVFTVAVVPLLQGAGRAVDLQIIWDAARRLVSHSDLYQWQEIVRNHFGAVYKIPPLFALLISPLVQLPFTVSKIVWRAVSLTIFILVVVAVVRRYLKGHPWWLIGFAVALALLFRPIYDTLNYGQVDLVLLGCIWAAMVLSETKWTPLGGALLGLATMFKVYPGAFVVLLASRRDWKAVLGFLVGLGLIVVATVPFVGLETYTFYVTAVLPRIGDGTAWVENQTLNGFLSRFFTDTYSSRPGPTNLYVQVGTYLGAAVFLGASLLLVRTAARRGIPDSDLDFGMFSAALLLSVPAAWIHYEAVLLPAFAALVFKYGHLLKTNRLALFLTIAGYALVAFGNIWSYGPFLTGWLSIPVYTGVVHQGLWRTVLSYKFFGIVALWLALGVVRLSEIRSKGLTRPKQVCATAP